MVWLVTDDSGNVMTGQKAPYKLSRFKLKWPREGTGGRTTGSCAKYWGVPRTWRTEHVLTTTAEGLQWDSANSRYLITTRFTRLGCYKVQLLFDKKEVAHIVVECTDRDVVIP